MLDRIREHLVERRRAAERWWAAANRTADVELARQREEEAQRADDEAKANSRAEIEASCRRVGWWWP